MNELTTILHKKALGMTEEDINKVLNPKELPLSVIASIRNFDVNTKEGSINYIGLKLITKYALFGQIMWLITFVLSLSASLVGVIMTFKYQLIMGVILGEGLKIMGHLVGSKSARYTGIAVSIGFGVYSAFAVVQYVNSSSGNYQQVIQNYDNRLASIKESLSDLRDGKSDDSMLKLDIARFNELNEEWIKYKSLQMKDWTNKRRLGKRNGEWMINNRSHCQTEWCEKIFRIYDERLTLKNKIESSGDSKQNAISRRNKFRTEYNNVLKEKNLYIANNGNSSLKIDLISTLVVSFFLMIGLEWLQDLAAALVKSYGLRKRIFRNAYNLYKSRLKKTLQIQKKKEVNHKRFRLSNLFSSLSGFKPVLSINKFTRNHKRAAKKVLTDKDAKMVLKNCKNGFSRSIIYLELSKNGFSKTYANYKKVLDCIEPVQDGLGKY